MRKIFIDTNVLIDFVCCREEFLKAAKTIFLMGHEKEVELVISSLSFINTYYVGKRNKLPVEQLKHSLLMIATFVTISDIGRNDILASLTETEFKDFEDAVQYYSAKKWYADVIVTRNKKDFQNADIPVLTPDEFLVSI